MPKPPGQEVVEKALLLFYASQEEKAPAWAKGTIAAALGYFIVPLDAITDLAPGVGYADDLGVLVLAIAAVATYINEDVRNKTAAKMRCLVWRRAGADRRPGVVRRTAAITGFIAANHH